MKGRPTLFPEVNDVTHCMLTFYITVYLLHNNTECITKAGFLSKLQNLKSWSKMKHKKNLHEIISKSI